MNASERLLSRALETHYRDDFPALLAQIGEWSLSRPLDGLLVLDASPVFANTLPKYAALIAAGARVKVRESSFIPGDRRLLETLPEFGLEIADEDSLEAGFDIVLDCGGICSKVKSRLGYAELTKSGLAAYKDFAQSVFLADEGVIKQIETRLGTGDGFWRALVKLGHGNFDGRRLVVFGAGKVGFGIARACSGAGFDVTVVDVSARRDSLRGYKFANMEDCGEIERLIAEAWCVVTATGIAGALSKIIPAEKISSSNALLANMGVEDEFGSGVPEGRVLNSKRPLNFILEEPTRLRYIDPTLALHNWGALLLKEKSLPVGVSSPPAELEKKILKTVMDCGKISFEFGELLAEINPNLMHQEHSGGAD